LSADEISTTYRVIQADRRFPSGALLPVVSLKEPPKDLVLAWSSGTPFQRQAFANVFDRAKNHLFEVVVDIPAQRVVSWTARPGRQPAIAASEYDDAEVAVRADARWQTAMRQRGVDPADVYLDGWSVSDAALPGVRLLRHLSFFQGQLPNPYDRPIEGVVVDVDLNQLSVVGFIDTGLRPVAKTISGSSSRPRAGLQPLIVTQPNGPSFQLNGNAVAWQGWHFRIGFTPREGLVLFQIGYEQNGVVRPVIYRISLNEIYVPYGIPDSNWAWRAALDIGEYNLGQYAESLQANVDVPSNAVFFDEVAATDTGDPPSYALPQAVALYEREAGSLWDRSDPTSGAKDARYARELVVSAAYPQGNYTYGTNYVFRLDGGIDVRVLAAGTTLNEGVRSTAEGERYGATVAQFVAAPNHQHFFSFRIDFDVDGTRNRLVEESVRSVNSPQGNAFVSESNVLGSEQFRDYAIDRRWVVESTTKVNALGRPTAYELRPIDTVVPYSDPSFAPLQRAAFAQHALWVSRYREGELYATGDYPNQSAPGEGLPRYVGQHESVDGQDLVVWYTTGLTHVPTVE
jgi:primary-amine oxidase